MPTERISLQQLCFRLRINAVAAVAAVAHSDMGPALSESSLVRNHEVLCFRMLLMMALDPAAIKTAPGKLMNQSFLLHDLQTFLAIHSPNSQD